MDIIKKFATKEDTYNIHKTLGLVSLCHYGYRFYNIVSEGDSGLADDMNLYFWIFVHMTLSASSLMFHIPNNRVAKRPMIYPEFRLHSILFAFRSLLVMTFFDIMWVRCLITLATSVLADMVTKYYRNNDTTMRGMPFSDNIPNWFRAQINTFYSVSQVLATMNMVFGRTIDSPFVVLFPIQIAAFLMTCVRKGLIGADGWHGLYSIALLLNYWYGWFSQGAGRPWFLEILEHGIPSYWKWAILFCVYRFHFNVNKYLLWMPILAFAYTNA